MSKPLSGIRIATSLIADEIDAQIREKVRSLGGEFHHQISAKTDFLVLGKRWSQEYMFAICHDITLVSQETFFNLHMDWVAGNEVQWKQQLSDHKLKPFEGLLVCLSSMDSDQKFGFQRLLETAGATCSAALTPRCQLLVSPVSKGRKYDGAKRWNIPVVVPKYLKDSVQFGAALDPQTYDPGDATASMQPPLKAAKPSDTIATTSERMPLQLKRKSLSNGMPLSKRLPTSIGATLTSMNKPPELDLHLPFETKRSSSSSGNKLFTDIKFTFVGFDSRQLGILRRTISSWDGKVNDLTPDYVIVNSINPVFPETRKNTRYITEWGVERSIYYKTNCLESIWNQPVYVQPCSGFQDLQICISGFEDIDQRHATLLVKLLGAVFSDTLRSERDLLVASSAQAQKVPFAIRWGIPVVTINWLWQCAQAGKVLPISEEQCLDRLGFRPSPKPKANGNSSASVNSSFDPGETNAELPLDNLSPESQSSVPEVRYHDDDAVRRAEMLLELGEKPLTPPPIEPEVSAVRSGLTRRQRAPFNAT